MIMMPCQSCGNWVWLTKYRTFCAYCSADLVKMLLPEFRKEKWYVARRELAEGHFFKPYKSIQKKLSTEALVSGGKRR